MASDRIKDHTEILPNHTRSFSQLASELKHMVLEKLSREGNPSDVLNAALVCKQWSEICIPVLWAHIHVTNENIIDFVGTLEKFGEMKGPLILSLSFYLRPMPMRNQFALPVLSSLGVKCGDYQPMQHSEKADDTPPKSGFGKMKNMTIEMVSWGRYLGYQTSVQWDVLCDPSFPRASYMSDVMSTRRKLSCLQDDMAKTLRTMYEEGQLPEIEQLTLHITNSEVTDKVLVTPPSNICRNQIIEDSIKVWPTSLGISIALREFSDLWYPATQYPWVCYLKHTMRFVHEEGHLGIHLMGSLGEVIDSCWKTSKNKVRFPEVNPDQTHLHFDALKAVESRSGLATKEQFFCHFR
ncbi:hypothetical protein N0V90_008045 [Kalmusia sp. IMI 367209]|nr:hypothetical protein N0V90_008045 [Kalmusia sp. IMI 367209]